MTSVGYKYFTLEQYDELKQQETMIGYWKKAMMQPYAVTVCTDIKS